MCNPGQRIFRIYLAGNCNHNVARIKHDCLQAREKLAYVAQERWLRRFDLSLESEFDVDPFTVLVRTLCMQ
ncbi:MAG TPA: hypothetical protein VNK48_09130 [Xanthobacteraceae bacterium]|nr:hypothetical protein [Xanthobacteraceae bacterium]